MAMLALFGIGFWLLVLRPAKAKQAQQQQLVNQLKTGDKVMTTAGLFGYIIELTDDEVGVEIADGVTVRMVRAAISRVVPPVDLTVDSDSDAALDGEPVVDAIDVTETPAARHAVAESVPGTGPTATN